MGTHRVVSIRPVSLGNLLGVISLFHGGVVTLLVAAVHLSSAFVLEAPLDDHLLLAARYGLLAPPLFFLLAYSSGCSAAAFYNRFVARTAPLVVETTES